MSNTESGYESWVKLTKCMAMSQDNETMSRDMPPLFFNFSFEVSSLKMMKLCLETVNLETINHVLRLSTKILALMFYVLRHYHHVSRLGILCLKKFMLYLETYTHKCINYMKLFLRSRKHVLQVMQLSLGVSKNSI